MAPLLLALLAGVTGLLLAGAESPPPDPSPLGAGGTPLGAPGCPHPPTSTGGLQLSDGDVTGRGGLPGGSLRCAVCKRVVPALRGVLVDPHDKAGVSRVAHRVCGQLWVGAGLCRRLLRHALAPIEEALRRHQDPATLCTRLRWCPSPRPHGTHRL